MTIKRVRSKTFSVVLERTVLELQGIPCIELEDINTPKQNIMTSRSFGQLTNNLFELQEAIRVHASKGAEKLRKQHSVAHAVLVFLKTNQFREDLTQYHPSIVMPLPSPTDDSRVIVQTAQQGLNAIYRKHCLFMKAGVMMLDLMDKDKEKFDLFSAPQSRNQQQKADKLMQTMDLINKKMGAHTVQLGGRNPQAAWHLKRELLSLRYTSRWHEIPTVKS